jgi:hypothetical protein
MVGLRPDKVAELRQLWWQEAERNRVLPLLGGLAVMFGDLPPLPTTARFTFKGTCKTSSAAWSPRIFGRSYAIEARLHVPDDGAQGVIVANADCTTPIHSSGSRPSKPRRPSSVPVVA